MAPTGLSRRPSKEVVSNTQLEDDVFAGQLFGLLVLRCRHPILDRYKRYAERMILPRDSTVLVMCTDNRRWAINKAISHNIQVRVVRLILLWILIKLVEIPYCSLCSEHRVHLKQSSGGALVCDLVLLAIRAVLDVLESLVRLKKKES